MYPAPFQPYILEGLHPNENLSEWTFPDTAAISV
jgi:hypothetical protein